MRKFNWKNPTDKECIAMTTEAELNTVKDKIDEKAHPWRVCPLGQHFVRAHSEHIPPSKKHPQGDVVIRNAHCAHNPSHKDLLSFDEIHVISNNYFETLSGRPTAGILTKFHKADDYDLLIRGWVHYWNEVFDFEDPLNPNLIKALMATESSFEEQAVSPNHKNRARGLLQITEETLHILNDHKGELSNHLMFIRAKDLFDPSVNICSGVRWLFRKQITASSRLKRKATWEEAIIEYKAYWKIIDAGQIPKAIVELREYYKQLEEEK